MVTGAGSGSGRALALSLGAKGCALALARCVHRSQLIIGERSDSTGFRLVRQME